MIDLKETKADLGDANAQNTIANTMNTGEIIVHGSAGEYHSVKKVKILNEKNTHGAPMCTTRLRPTFRYLQNM